MKSLNNSFGHRYKHAHRQRGVVLFFALIALVVMSLAQEEGIGLEKHDVDQFIYVVDGQGTGVLDGSEEELDKGDAICVPAGTWHNIINSGDEPMKLITVYSPPEHPAGLVEREKVAETPSLN